MRLGENTAVVDIHIRFCQIPDRNQPFQKAAVRHRSQGNDIILLHQVPGFFQGDILPHPRRFPDLDILYLGLYGLYQIRLFHMKIIQHKLGFRIHFPSPGRLIDISCSLLF